MSDITALDTSDPGELADELEARRERIAAVDKTHGGT